ncbi:MAG: MazG nucleotide pyrophosphohydrolase domain-containing protein [Myxococcales bacterium]
MPQLRDRPILSDFQEYVVQLERERGFSHQTLLQKCLLLGEEMGELFKSIRKIEGLSMDDKSKVGAAADELADVFIYLCAIANRLGIDLEKAFRDKEAINQTRTWK